MIYPSVAYHSSVAAEIHTAAVKWLRGLGLNSGHIRDRRCQPAGPLAWAKQRAHTLGKTSSFLDGDHTLEPRGASRWRSPQEALRLNHHR